MRHISYVFVSTMMILGLGCSDSPAESEAASTTSVASAGGAGGAGGSDGGGGAGGSAGSGGSGGGAPTFVFNCTDVAAQHAAVKVRLDTKPPGHIAIDGAVFYPANSGFAGIGWAVLHIEQDGSADKTVKDFGLTPSSTSFQLNLGMSADADPAQPVPAVDQGTWFCNSSTCSNADILCCYGDKEMGRVQGGVVSGGITWGNNGKNPSFVAQ